jgi:hypothetical protein
MATPRDIDRLLRRAKKGDRKAIVRLVKLHPESLGNTQPFAAIAEAKATIVKAAERFALPAAEQEAADRADEFLDSVAEAVRYTPKDVRTRAILQEAANLSAHLQRARELILSVPRADRSRPSTTDKLAKQTKLDRESIKVIANAPRTGYRGLAREMAGRKFNVTGEHVRKLQLKYRHWNIRPNNLVVLGSRKRTRA